MTTKETVAEAIRTTRESLGYTQQQLAEAAGLANLQTVSAIELAQREVKSWELARIARALRTTVAALLDVASPQLVRVFWRRAGHNNPSEQEAIFRERARRYAQLEQLCGVSPAAELPVFPLDPERATHADIERLAAQASRTLDLGSRPAASLISVLESRFRVKIFYEDLGERSSAACLRGDFGSAILMNRAESPWRRNYSFAHEVFHLLTWDAVEAIWPAEGEPSWYPWLEKLANSFASSLLLPADEVQAEVASRIERNPLTDVDLIEIARDFDVSADALVWRLVNLRFMSESDARERLASETFQRLNKLSTAGLWDAPPSGLPERYQMLVRLAHEDGTLSRVRAASFLECSAAELYTLDWSEIGEEAATPAA